MCRRSDVDWNCDAGEHRKCANGTAERSVAWCAGGDIFADYIAEAAQRFGVPASWDSRCDARRK